MHLTFDNSLQILWYLLIVWCSGRYKFVEAEIILDIEKLQDAHDVASSIEEEIYDCFPEIDKILIHYEPEKL